ncbi:MAG: 1-deoxy-D-xylulose-5-phosphate reductoisomerase, partial [Lentisphaerae bacterium]|nr:1-deoxy-D-xylulose-5-phosphate reductoisomerase [Lentisphaerota bacterium]
MKDIILLGSTGSIGQNTVRVVEAFPSLFRIVGLAVRRDVDGVMEQASRLGVKHVAVTDDAAARSARSTDGVRVYGGEGATEDLVRGVEADMVVCAVVGMAGLAPVMAAAEQGRDIALATKEVLVAAGEPVLETCRRHGSRILPVDSEHSAVFQCLAAGGEGGDPLSRIILTASGGPFGSQPDIDLATVTLEQVLDHPRWDMGRKVTVDSATLMNKGLEIVEAHWLFDTPVEQIDVLIHPESIV